MIVFTEEKKFSREDVQELFLSVGWISGQYPGRLFKALMNFVHCCYGLGW